MAEDAEPAEEMPVDNAFAFDLPVECSLRDAEQLQDQIADAGDSAAIVLNAEGVEMMSASMVLVLASAADSRAEEAPKIAVTGVTAAFTDAFKELGFFKNLMSMEFRT